MWLLVRVALEKGFSVDEFQYAHAAWLVAVGKLPYRDFFEVHFPLVYLLGSPVFWFAGSDPAAIWMLRWLMLPFALLTCAAAGLLNRHLGFAAAVLGPLFLIATSDWTTLATEIRPDALGAALFLAALATVRLPLGDRARCFAAGVLFAWSAASAQKAAFYGGLTFFFAILLDRRTLPRPLMFGAGAACGVVPIVWALTGEGMAGAFLEWAVLWGAEHQRQYPGFSWTREVTPILLKSPLLVPLAAVGLMDTVRKRNDTTLVAALVFTFLSAALQTAPFRYSFLATLALVAVFAARGVAWLLELRGHPAARTAVVAVAVLGAGATLISGALTLHARLYNHNRHQLETLEAIGRLLGPGDVAYDNSGSFVARPHVDFYFYTDKYLRLARARELETELPRKLVESGCVLRLKDAREAELPTTVQDFLEVHYQPWSGDLSLWGQRYVAPHTASPLEDLFLAPRAGAYFVDPPHVAAEGHLELDGRRLTSEPFHLTRGEHTLRYVGPPRAFHVLWLPADGQRWTPKRDEPTRFSRIFY